MDIVIRNEDAAWKWLERAINGDFPDDSPINLRFDGWPSLDLQFSGHDFNSSVPTRIMPPLLDAQKEIHRLYSQVRYGRQNLKKLTAEEREKLELVVRVKKGSSVLETNLQDVLTDTFQSAVDKMDPQTLLIAILGISLIWGSNIAWKAWLKNRAKEKDIESRVQMSKLEKEKLELLADAYRRVPSVKELSEGIDDFRNDSLHKLRPADSFRIPQTGVSIDGNYAAEITNKPREQSLEMRIDGEFVILSVVSGETQGFKIKVKRIIDGVVINVSVPEGALPRDQLDILKNSEWAKKPVVMQLNARQLRGEITAAVLVSASAIERAVRADT